MTSFLEGDKGENPLPAHQLTKERGISKKSDTVIFLIQAESETQKLNASRIIRTYHGYTPKTNRVGRFIDWLIERQTVERNKHGKVIDIINKEIIGTIGLMDTPALALRVRDRVIGWNRQQQKRNMHKIVANYRFTMMPNAFQNDATRSLSAMLKICQRDWLAKYQKPIVWIETVVKNRKYGENLMVGQCYKGSGFRLLGLTSGGAGAFHCLKFGSNQQEGGETRGNLFDGCKLRVYAKPLVKNFRDELKK